MEELLILILKKTGKDCYWINSWLGHFGLNCKVIAVETDLIESNMMRKAKLTFEQKPKLLTLLVIDLDDLIWQLYEVDNKLIEFIKHTKQGIAIEWLLENLKEK